MSTPGNRDKKGGGIYTTKIEDVIQRVVFNGASVRAKTEDGKKDGSIGLNKQSFNTYWVAPELFHLVSSAPIPPSPRLPRPGIATSGRLSAKPKETSSPDEDASSAAGSSSASTLNKALALVASLTAEQYIAALAAIEPVITSKQKAMLIGHAAAPGQTLSMSTIAELGGYDNFESANIQYGILAKQFASHFGIDGLENQTQAIASAGPRAQEKNVWMNTMASFCRHPSIVCLIPDLFHSQMMVRYSSTQL